MAEIDFVLLWVDGNDPEWRREMQRHRPKSEEGGESVRFRDWENLRYIFRAYEYFAPWVRTIHFVTYGHLPTWLNISHPKLNIVKHSDYLETENLPVFNAHPLEVNLHKIKGLSEKFVYFNDDFFIVSEVDLDRYFRKGLPRDILVNNALSSASGVGHFVLNALEILNRHFDKRRSMRQNLWKWFHPSYGADSLRNIALLPWGRFTGFIDPHMPQPFLRSTFEELWRKEEEVLQRTSRSRFRSCTDVSQYLFRYWQLASGCFEPVSMRDTRYITLNMEILRNGEVGKMLQSNRYKMVCFNDSETISDEEFPEAKRLLQGELEKILPQKSSFEIR